jgi:hypothetical protein
MIYMHKTPVYIWPNPEIMCNSKCSKEGLVSRKHQKTFVYKAGMFPDAIFPYKYNEFSHNDLHVLRLA